MIKVVIPILSLLLGIAILVIVFAVLICPAFFEDITEEVRREEENSNNNKSKES